MYSNKFERRTEERHVFHSLIHVTSINFKINCTRLYSRYQWSANLDNKKISQKEITAFQSKDNGILVYESGNRYKDKYMSLGYLTADC